MPMSKRFQKRKSFATPRLVVVGITGIMSRDEAPYKRKTGTKFQ
jgi:hypothetical protein